MHIDSESQTATTTSSRALAAQILAAQRPPDPGPAIALRETASPLRDHSLADELGLTVIWSGIGSSDILREARTARFSALRRPAETAAMRQRSVPTLWVNRLPPRCLEHPNEWVSTLLTFDGHLRLREHRPGSLLDYQEELHRITDGLMEHLAPLLGMAGQLAILDRTEAITLDVIHDAAQYLDLIAADDGAKWK